MKLTGSAARTLSFMFLVAAVLLLAGCGGTKVYKNDKTLVFRGTMYNLSTVQKFSSRIDGTLPGGVAHDLSNLDRDAVEALLDEHRQFSAKSFIVMDTQEAMYEARMIERWSDYNKMAKNLESAMKDISKFMANKKKTQLTLK